MIKVYRKEMHSYDEVRIFNFETGEFKSYHTAKNIGFPFGIPNNTTAKEMGYKDIKECFKNLKERHILGNEVDYKEQIESDRIGYIKLGAERIKRAGRINTNDFEDVINKLAKYGMGYCDAQNSIIATYENEVM